MQRRILVIGVDTLSLPACPAKHRLPIFGVSTSALDAERLAALGTGGANLRLGPEQDSAVGAVLFG
jgi:hypothetical protein